MRLILVHLLFLSSSLSSYGMEINWAVKDMPVESVDHEWVPYRVQEGDTLYKILRLLRSTGVNIKNLSKASQLMAQHNPTIQNADVLSIGQKILIPRRLVEELSATTHNYKLNRILRSVASTLPTESGIQINYYEQANIYVGHAEEGSSVQRQVASQSTVPRVETVFKKKVAKSAYSIRPQVFFSRLDSVDKATGGEAFVTSQLNYGLHASLQQNYSSIGEIKYMLELSYQDYSSPSGGIQQLENETAIYYGAGIQWRGLNWGRWSVLTSAWVNSEPYFSASSPTVGLIQSALQPQVRLGLQARIVDSLRGRIYASNYFPSLSGDIEADTGLLLGMGLSYDQSLSSSSFMPQIITVSFEQANLETNLTEQTTQYLGFRLGWSL